MNLVRGTWFSGRASYIEIEITEIATGRPVWKVVRYPFPGETPPEYWRNDRFSLGRPLIRIGTVPNITMSIEYLPACEPIRLPGNGASLSIAISSQSSQRACDSK
jgi:hypothetical protein